MMASFGGSGVERTCSALRVGAEKLVLNELRRLCDCTYMFVIWADTRISIYTI